jgi:site-specific DNA-methyltransferase (adenine-specific)
VAGTFKERAGFHGCQMPEQLLARIIRTCSNEDELVVDPFSGSATTLVVAKKLGRRFLGFEISEDYVRRGRERLQKVQPGDPLRGAADPLTSCPATVNGKRHSPQRRGPKQPSPERRGKRLIELPDGAGESAADG